MKTKWKNWLKAAGVRAVKKQSRRPLSRRSAPLRCSARWDWIVVASASVLAGVLAPHKRFRPAGVAWTRTATVSRIGKGQSEKR